MGHDYCCVVQCKNSGRNSSCKFYIFPRAAYKLEQRIKWIAAVKRRNDDGIPWSPKPHDKICSAHFIGGKKSEEQLNPSYVPTIFPTIYRKKQIYESQLPNDMQNYMQYRIMGSVNQVRMNPGVVPSKFECQSMSSSSSQVKKPKHSKGRSNVLRKILKEDSPCGSSGTVSTVRPLRECVPDSSRKI